MLFERETVTPQGRLATMEELFSRVARRDNATPGANHVPVEALEAFRDLETPLRYMLEAAAAGCPIIYSSPAEVSDQQIADANIR